jgi:hypothetical protein
MIYVDISSTTHNLSDIATHCNHGRDEIVLIHPTSFSSSLSHSPPVPSSNIVISTSCSNEIGDIDLFIKEKAK